MIKNNLNAGYFLKNLFVVIGLVLIWRGVWYIMDYVDIVFFGGNHAFTAVAGIIFGLFILYIPDGDLKEITNL